MRSLALRVLLSLALTFAACAGDPKDGGVGDVVSDVLGGEVISIVFQPSKARYVQGAEIDVRCQLDVNPLPADVEGRFAVMWLDGERGEQVRLNEVGAAWFTLVAPSVGGVHEVECSVGRPDGATSIARASFDVNRPPESGVLVVMPEVASAASTLSYDWTEPPSDRDGDVLTETRRWFVDGELADEAVRGQPVVLPVSLEKGQSWELEVTISDGFEELTRTSTSVVILNTPPSIGEVRITPTAASSGNSLRCVASNIVDTDGDEVSLSYAWFEASSAAPVAGLDTDTVSGEAIHAGQRWRCAVTPADDEEAGAAVESAPVDVLNSAPRPPVEVHLSPEAGDADTAFTCEMTLPDVPDIDGDPVTPVYTWQINDVALPGGEGQATFTPSSQGRGDALRCCVSLSDGASSSPPTCAEAVVLSDRAPLAGTVSILPVVADERSILTCVPAGFVDPDGDELTYGVTWTVAGEEVAGAEDGPLSGASFDEGDSVSCAITASDGALWVGPVVAKAPVVIGNAAPIVTAVTVTPSAARNGESVECDAAVDEPDPADSVLITYAWVDENAAEVGAGATLLIEDRAVGGTVRCVAVAEDETSVSAAVESVSVPIVNTTPSLDGPPELGPTPLSSTTVATCRPPTVTDPDPQTTSVQFTWFRNGGPVAGVEGATLAPERFARGDVLQCQATPTDGVEDGTPQKSALVTVTNSAPVVTSVTLDPTSGTAGTLFTCSAEGEDADADDVFFSWAWYLNGEKIDGQSAAQVFGVVSEIGDVLTCEATPWDDDGAGESAASNEASYVNSPPTLTGAQLGPADAWVGTTLTCQAQGFSDPEGAAPAYGYEWLVNGTVVEGAAGAQLSGVFEHYDSVQCRVRPYDGIVHGSPRVSNVVSVKNSAPSAPVVTFEPATPGPGELLTCVVAEPASDPDGDGVTLSYRWSADGEVIAGHTAPFLPSGQTALCQEVTCTATPSDGLPEGVGPSGTVTAIVTAPEVCDGVDSDCDGETDEGLSCGHRVDIVFDLPPGVSSGALIGPLADLVTEDRSAPGRLEVTLETAADGLQRLPIQWTGPDGGLRKACEMAPSGSPWLPHGLPRVWSDGSPVAVTLRRFEDGSGCAPTVDLGAYALPALWWEGPSQLAFSGATLDPQAYPCAVLLGGFSGWWSGPVLRRGADANLHLDLRSIGGVPAGRYQFAIYGIEGECPSEDYYVLTTDPMDDLLSYPYWIIEPPNMSSVGKAWFFPTPDGSGARLMSDGRGNILPAAGWVPLGGALPSVVSDNLCVDGEVHACESHDVPGESLCAGGTWLRCTPQSTGNPAEVFGDGVDNDHDGFTDEGASNLVTNPSFENGLEGWLVNDSVPMWNEPASDGVGNGTIKLSGGAVGSKAGELNLIQPNSIPPAADWHLQLLTETPMVAGETYVLTYRVWASARVRTSVQMGDPSLEYRSAGLYVGAPDHYLWAGPRWTTRRIVFTAIRTVPDALLTFSAGLDPGTVVLDDVSLEPHAGL